MGKSEKRPRKGIECIANVHEHVLMGLTLLQVWIPYATPTHSPLPHSPSLWGDDHKMYGSMKIMTEAR